MKSFLPVLMVLMVSGDRDVTINSTIEDSVLLPCPCKNRNPDMEFRWQMESPRQAKVYLTTSGFNDSYKNRAKIFLTEDKYNCSLLLTNVTAEDQGKYRCSFSEEDTYTMSFIHLNVSAQYNVCRSPAHHVNDIVKEFQCDVEGRYRDTEVQWYLDGHVLTKSPTTKITFTSTLNISTGLYSFKSTIKLSGTSEPTCEVQAKGISTRVSNNCMGKD
ncbi:butyrophilin subfamily 3 member A2 [Anabas testudineus]|uniref:butyrophilin subfamily 3 member A2 n=1 Tax=Anabas testudineus TaxID=64144 RepID=UPI000E464BD4|nr:butyrophilin subfamily 3 member A2 [Anabas testudineus]